MKVVAARIGGGPRVGITSRSSSATRTARFPTSDYDDYPDGFTNEPGIQIVAASDADARELVRRLRAG